MGIDLASYRARIGSAANLMQRISSRKVQCCRKVKQLPELVVTPNILRILLAALKCISSAILACIYCVILYGFIHAYVASLSKIRVEMTKGSQDICICDSWERQPLDSSFETDVGLCISSIGSVAFIGILLLIAGIESNPGPKEELTKSDADVDERPGPSHFTKQEVFQFCESQSTKCECNQTEVKALPNLPNSEATVFSQSVIVSLDRPMEVQQKIDSAQFWDLPTESIDVDNSNQHVTICSEHQCSLKSKADRLLSADATERSEEKDTDLSSQDETGNKFETEEPLTKSKVPAKDVRSKLGQSTLFRKSPPRLQSKQPGCEKNKSLKTKLKNFFKRSAKQSESEVPKIKTLGKIREETSDGGADCRAIDDVNPEQKFDEQDEIADITPEQKTDVQEDGPANKVDVKQKQELVEKEGEEPVKTHQMCLSHTDNSMKEPVKTHQTSFCDSDNSMIKLVKKKGTLQIDASKQNIVKSNFDYILQQVTKEKQPVKYVNISRTTMYNENWSEFMPELNAFLFDVNLQKIEEMNLSNMGLVQVPEAVGELQQRLVVLNIARNKVCSLGPILRCEVLEKLTVTSNNISAIPENIHQLKRLRELHIDENPVYKITAFICRCENLRILKIGSRNTRVIAPEVLNMNDLRIDVAMKHQKILSHPTYEQLRDPDKLRIFLNKHETDAMKVAVKSRRYAGKLISTTILENGINFFQLDLTDN